MSTTDLSGLIADFATGTYTVTRGAGPGSYAEDGKFAPASTSTVNVLAAVVPADGTDVQHLPEGMRTRSALAVFTVGELNAQAPGQQPDVIEIDGFAWQVQHSERWTAGNFFRSVVVREDP
jgi:hypothetical protein